MKLLQPLARETPVLGVFHQPEMTARFCTRVIAIKHGKVVYDGDPVLSHSQLEDIYGDELMQVLRPASAPSAEPLAPTIPFVVRVDGADARLLVKQAT
jgi:ABC-type cobalamin/Fe3+-siderophores transport system ATPase subunit